MPAARVDLVAVLVGAAEADAHTVALLAMRGGEEDGGGDERARAVDPRAVGVRLLGHEAADVGVAAAVRGAEGDGAGGRGDGESDGQNSCKGESVHAG